MLFDIKKGIEFINEKEKCDTEDIRYELGFEIELSDKIRNNFYSLKKIKINKYHKIFIVEYHEHLKNKSDLIILIKNSNDGIPVDNLLKSYFDVKTVLLELVKFKERDRKVILIKGTHFNDLYIYPYDFANYLFTSEDNIISWHLNNLKKY